jgi:hypothetical protein
MTRGIIIRPQAKARNRKNNKNGTGCSRNFLEGPKWYSIFHHLLRTGRCDVNNNGRTLILSQENSKIDQKKGKRKELLILLPRKEEEW